MDKNLDRIRELAGMAPVQEDTTVVGTMYQIRDKLTEAALSPDLMDILTTIARGGKAPSQNNRKSFYKLKAMGLIEPLVVRGAVRKGYVITTSGKQLVSGNGLGESGLDYSPAKGGYNAYDNAGSDTCDQCGCDIDNPKADCDCSHSITEDGTNPKVAMAIAVLDSAIENEMDFEAGGGYGDVDDIEGNEEFGAPDMVHYLESLKKQFLKGDVPTTVTHIEKIGSALDEIVEYGDGDTIQDILLGLSEAFGIDTDLDEAAGEEPKTEQQQMREWSNSVYKNYEDRGHIQAQPEGETVDNSLRRYLNAEPHKVQVSESHTPKKLSESYKTFKGK